MILPQHLEQVVQVEGVAAAITMALTKHQPPEQLIQVVEQVVEVVEQGTHKKVVVQVLLY
jgi:hypothetical protein